MPTSREVGKINFKSNVERAVYEVFNRVCEGLGYDWRKYTSDEKYSFLFATILQETYIDGYPEKREDVILRREVRDFGGIHCKIGIITPKGREFTEYDIKKMLTESSDSTSNDEELKELKISDEKINEVVKEILEEFKE